MKKTRNPLSYLGFLGFIGLLGLVYLAPSFLIFLLFFFFFTYRNMVADELFWQNVRRAGLRGFAAGITVGAAWTLVVQFRGIWLSSQGRLFASVAERQAALTAAEDAVSLPADVYSQMALAMGGFTWTILVSLSVFIFTLMYYNRREKQYAEEEPPC